MVLRHYILRTEHLVVTSWVPTDVDDLFAMHSDAETMRFVRDGRPETREETVALVDQYIAEHAASGFTKWRVVDLDDRFVGRAGFGTHADGRELGYTIRREQWGRGLATEVADALVSWHLTHTGSTPLYAFVAIANPASRRVLQKIGFGLVTREDHHGVLCDMFRYGSARARE